MKQLFLALVAFSIVAFAPGSALECKHLKERVLQPSRSIASFLQSSPTADTLAGPGCEQILEALRDLPTGARSVRALGARGIENVHSRCNAVVNSIQYPCSRAEGGPLRCLPEAYSYCGEWEYSTTNQPKYELAMELSTLVDVAYDRAQQLCGMAMSVDSAGALAAAKELTMYLNERVIPEGEALYGMSCAE